MSIDVNLVGEGIDCQDCAILSVPGTAPGMGLRELEEEIFARWEYRVSVELVRRGPRLFLGLGRFFPGGFDFRRETCDDIESAKDLKVRHHWKEDVFRTVPRGRVITWKAYRGGSFLGGIRIRFVRDDQALVQGRIEASTALVAEDFSRFASRTDEKWYCAYAGVFAPGKIVPGRSCAIVSWDIERSRWQYIGGQCSDHLPLLFDPRTDGECLKQLQDVLDGIPGPLVSLSEVSSRAGMEAVLVRHYASEIATWRLGTHGGKEYLFKR